MRTFLTTGGLLGTLAGRLRDAAALLRPGGGIRPPAGRGWAAAPGAEVLGRRVRAGPATGTYSLPGLGKAEAEAVLDWLESAGCRTLEARYVEGEGFTVRWHPPGPA
jgi:hypothetical protein